MWDNPFPVNPSRIIAIGFSFAALGASLPGDVTLSPLFGDHSVLQRGKSVSIWGRAAVGESVAVTFRDQTVKAIAGPDGRWMVRLKPLAASGEPAELIAAGKNTVVARDVLVGDVWLASGQSNMELPVRRAGHREQEIASANFPLIREIRIQRAVAMTPADFVKTGGWLPASPKTVGDFSAVGYFFARDLHRALGVPIGIINSSWGGTAIEAWMSDDARRSTSLAARLDARWREAMREWPPARVALYSERMAAWEKADARAEATGAPNPLPWPPPPASDDSPALPGGLFNAMIAPLEPEALSGILWYQGEQNVGHSGEYAELFTAMIRSWRSGWGQGDLPFYFVQIANFDPSDDRTGRNWARLREAQAQALALPATGMAVTIDIGDAKKIHPTNKQEVGRRLALIARARLYGFSDPFSGPEFLSATREGRAFRVRFKPAAVRLVARGKPAQALEVAGADRVFYPAEAEIDGDSLLVSSPSVPDPAAVRYAWTDAPSANLYDGAGLPVAPFRSDNW
jgi:sialate O-acetylesterase